LKVSVDDVACTGHGRCYALAPDVFAPDEYGHCELMLADGEVPGELEQQAKVGRDNCPELAITITD